MTTTSNISVFENRFCVILGEKHIQFVIWDIEPEQVQAAKEQLATAFNLCTTFDEIERHMRINGFDCTLEDIYE